MSNRTAGLISASSVHCSWHRRGMYSCAVKSGSYHRTMQSIATKYLPIPSARWLPLSAETVPRPVHHKTGPGHPAPPHPEDNCRSDQRAGAVGSTGSPSPWRLRTGLRSLLRPANGDTGGLHNPVGLTRIRQDMKGYLPEERPLEGIQGALKRNYGSTSLVGKRNVFHGIQFFLYHTTDGDSHQK